MRTINNFAPLLLFFFVTSFVFYSCKTSREITDPDIAWEEKQYNLAADLYIPRYKQTEIPRLKAEIAFKIGECFRFSNDTKSAEDWYQKAAKNGYPDSEVFLHLGRMMKANEKYDEAIEEFKTYRREEPFSRKMANDEIRSSRQAKKWKTANTNVKVTNLETLNSSKSEYGAVMYEKGSVVFSAARPDATGEETYGWTGERFTDLYVADEKTNDQFSGVTSFSQVVNTQWNEGTVAFNKDFTELFFTRCGSYIEDRDNFCQIFHSEMMPGGEWSDPEALNLFNDSMNVGHPFLTHDGRMLLFSAETDDGLGGKDLYYSLKKGDEWTNPTNLGSQINTGGDELFPFVTEAGMLYFASNGHPGMGGLDVYSATKSGNRWIEPQNMKYPINSGADDFGLVFDKTEMENTQDLIRASGYFASSRTGGKGGDDIYRFIYKNKNIYEVEGVVLEKVFANPNDPNSGIVGYEPIPNSLVELKERVNKNNVFKDSLRATGEGEFYFELEAQSDYNVFASQKGYLNNSVNITTFERDPYKTVITVRVQIILDKIYKDREIVIPNIYYDFDSSSLRAESLPVLDTLLILVKENPDLKFELGAHTDSRGTEEYNSKLSERRAKSVVRYLVKNGIGKSRLRAVGYGETRLMNRCANDVDCTEEEHQENRRTTFKIVGEKLNLESVRPEEIRLDPKKE